MHETTVIIKEEIEIDDTKIKLELEDEEEEMPAMELSCVGGLMKIIEEQPNMITVPVNDFKSEDELKFIASLGTLDQQQKLFVTSASGIAVASALSEYQCKICNYVCENHLTLASHQINHQLNRQFCSYECGCWCNTLEEILEHEYRQHANGLNNSNCRLCLLPFQDAVSLDKHMHSHFYARRFVCAICRRQFELHQGLQLHRQHSRETCGKINYVDTKNTVGQLVAINKPETTLSSEQLCNVKIKSEPLEAEEMQLEELEQLEVVIKAEPKEEPEDDNWPTISSNSLPEQLRGKLRLPSIKKPQISNSTAKSESMTHANPTIQFVPVKKLQPISISTSPATTKFPNILKQAKTKNQQETSSLLKKNLLQAKTTPNVASNILKVLPSNCMVFKLPPNTKIIKMPATATNNNNNNVNNSCTIGNKVFTLPNAITISAAPKLQPVATPNESSPPVNRNAYFSDLSLFETLPESRKIIADFQNQIRSIEQTCPFPGTVLQSPKKAKTSTTTKPKRPEGIQLPPTSMSNVAVRHMRSKYPDHRFHWECPRCARCYEQYSAFCNHLTFVHSIPAEEFAHMQVDVKAFLKTNSFQTIATNSELPKPVVEIPATPTAPLVATPLVPVAAAAPKAAVVEEKTAVSASPAPPPTTVEATGKPAVAAKKPTKATKSTAQFQCDDCSKCFTTFGAMRIHKMIHTGELPHKCSYCDKRFRTPGQVRVHQRRHTGEKPFKCKVCSLDFTHRETLISHLSRHIGMKRYKCYGCDKNFVVVSGLRAHRRLRPDTCGKVKFTARAHGPRVRVIRGEVVFESHPEHNGYLRSEDPLNILSEMSQGDKKSVESSDDVS